MRTSFHFIRYSIERERGMKNGAITLVRTDLETRSNVISMEDRAIRRNRN